MLRRDYRRLRQEASSPLRLSRTPLAPSFTLLAAFFALPLAWSVLPSASVRLSPVSFRPFLHGSFHLVRGPGHDTDLLGYLHPR